MKFEKVRKALELKLSQIMIIQKSIDSVVRYPFNEAYPAFKALKDRLQGLLCEASFMIEDLKNYFYTDAPEWFIEAYNTFEEYKYEPKINKE